MRYAALVCLIGAAGALAEQLEVGPGKAFSSLPGAVTKARAGDVIIVHPAGDGKAYTRVAMTISTPRLTIKSAPGSRVVLHGEGFDFSGRGSVPRALVQFSSEADGCVLQGFELTGAHNDSANGAGVRIDRANDITIRDCIIHGNDNGIMSGGDGTEDAAANQLIENCIIHSNGNEKRAGYNHNLYLGGASATLIGCQIHSSLFGHNLKSRARRMTVMACYIHDAAQREIDFVDAKETQRAGSDCVIAGTTIVKAARPRGNKGVIHFGQDGGSHRDGTLWLVNSTIVSPFVTPVVTLSSRDARVEMWNNIVWDAGVKQDGQVLFRASRDETMTIAGTSNWISNGFRGSLPAALDKTTLGAAGALAPHGVIEKGSFRVIKGDAAFAGKAQALPEVVSKLLKMPLRQFVYPAGHVERPAGELPGAFTLE